MFHVEASSVDQVCAHQGCNCLVDPGQGVVKDGKNYCCQGCADGTGCENPNCDCNKS
ncbi:MAG: metallothionein [Planctomycetota bacterium]|nr:MAG: metallothionein [Planctomycetota bacterium]REJ90623.1 MAG: metallothionein [Planctomycetota bacterium]REK21024.1 MAG: metallothionein [Planctomycetota bacterium]REK38842.1 MAG: metallothionein [Planctomycetota bacterium]